MTDTIGSRFAARGWAGCGRGRRGRVAANHPRGWIAVRGLPGPLPAPPAAAGGYLRNPRKSGNCGRLAAMVDLVRIPTAAYNLPPRVIRRRRRKPPCCGRTIIGGNPYIKSVPQYGLRRCALGPRAALVHNGGERGQVQFVRSTLWAVPANWTCPLFPGVTRKVNTSSQLL
jgi:hypothetical protein